MGIPSQNRRVLRREGSDLRKLYHRFPSEAVGYLKSPHAAGSPSSNGPTAVRSDGDVGYHRALRHSLCPILPAVFNSS